MVNRLLDWWRVRWAANPATDAYSKYGLACLALSISFFALSLSGVWPDVSYILARVFLFGFSFELIRAIGRPRRPIPPDSAPLIRWTKRRAVVAVAATAVCCFLLLAAIGAIVE
jgi:hypothetical protein